jgi:hypothetical protein
VGIPARILEEETSTKDEVKNNTTKAASFTAYAVSDDNDKFNPETMSKALQTLLTHSAAQDKKIAALTKQLKTLIADTGSDAQVAIAFDIKQDHSS